MDITLMGNTVLQLEIAFQEWLPEEYRDPEKRHSDYPRETLISVLEKEGFFLSILPQPGAVDAVETMIDLGHNVKICVTTLPPIENPVGFLEQFQVIEKHFVGMEYFLGHVMMAKDRTFINCDILVSDDSQEGARIPTWKLVILDSWDDWREKLGI